MSALPVPELSERAAACAERLRAAQEVLLASHIDADGLTSAAIAATALERAGIPFETVFKNQLDSHEIATLAATDHETVLFTDFGSGQLDIITDHETDGDFTSVIADHHQPADASTEYHLNPLLFGIDGASELSGAGTSYVLARALADTDDNNDRNDNRIDDGASEIAGNCDLASLAVIGAVGDMQATGGELVGANQAIVEEGIEAGVLTECVDLALYGRQTRPLPKLLEYSTDVFVPGISNSESGSIGFLSDLDLDLKHDGEWRTWIDLDDEEQQIVVSALIQRALERGVPAESVDGLVGTTYTLPAEPVGTELRDASEFSTLLNATARYDRADVGLAVCLGNRDGALDQARHLLRNHRRNLSEGLQWVTNEGVTREEHVQWFDAGTHIRETIVGIVAGMAIGSEDIDRSLPIIAFASKSDDETKVSARASHKLVQRGLDLSQVMGQASGAVSGKGGGHDVAAGATIPAGREREFVEYANGVVGEQIG
jgi:single-stranded-DNA-specific exonuclease